MNTLIRSFVIFSILVTFAALPAWAGQVTGLIDFQAGTTAVADDVDANFGNVAAEVNDNAADIIDLDSQLSAHQSNPSAHHLPPGVETSYAGQGPFLITGTDLENDPTLLNTLTVTAPANGVILGIWTGWISGSDSDLVEIKLFINDNGMNDFFIVETTTTGSDYRSVSCHHVFPVTGGTEYTYEIRGHDFYGSPNYVSVYDPRITLLFFPLGFDGSVATTGVSSLAESQHDSSVPGGSQ